MTPTVVISQRKRKCRIGKFYFVTESLPSTPEKLLANPGSLGKFRVPNFNLDHSSCAEKIKEHHKKERDSAEERGRKERNRSAPTPEKTRG